jgi:predicted outer membrane repeat protein
MKKLLFILICAVAVFSCQKEKKLSVKAYFTTDKNEYGIDEPVFITNESVVEGGLIGICRWEWGDGHVSFLDNIDVISFDKAGEHVIKLTVYADGGGAMDEYSASVTIKDEYQAEDGVIYVGPSSIGAADGSSWDNAMSVSSFADILSGDMSGWNGKKFYIQGGEHVLATDKTIALNGPSTGRSTITLVGGFSGTGDSETTTFSGDGVQAIFDINGAVDVYLSRLTFANASGGAIKVKGDESYLELGRCTFTGCKADFGAALQVLAGTVSASNTGFASNTASSAGGAVWASGGTTTLQACSFTGNNAPEGGAILAEGDAVLELENLEDKQNSFSSNAATAGSGGALLIREDAQVEINEVIWSDNNASASDACGGAIWKEGSKDLEINGGSFSGNNCSNSGGAIYVTEGKLTLNGVKTITGNTAKYGGCITVAGSSSLYLNNCTFNNNKNTAGSTRGAALYAKNSSSINANGCTFTKNILTGNSSKGGAVYTENSSSSSFTSCYFGVASDTNSGNSVATGSSGGTAGAFYTTSTGTNNLSGCNFYYNEGRWGGAVCVKGENTSINCEQCTFAFNVAATQGGAFFSQGNSSFSSCVFRSNKATGTYGGAVVFETISYRSTATFDGCLFDGNYSVTGGAIYSKDSNNKTSCYMNACVFSGNYITNSSKKGTTIFMENGSICMNNCSFADNTYGNGWNDCDCWVRIEGDGTRLVLSNSTLHGIVRGKDRLEATGTDNSGLISVSGGGVHSLVNNIISPLSYSFEGSDYIKCYAIYSTGSATFKATSNKTGSVLISGTYNSGGTESNDCNDGSGISSKLGSDEWTEGSTWTNPSNHFGNLAWTPGVSASGSYWGWNGTLSAVSNANMDTLENINAAIKAADADFHSWLQSIGVLTKDARGQNRGAITWPGAYDNGQ